MLKAEGLSSYVSSSSQDEMGDSGNEDDLVAGPMDIDDPSMTRKLKPRGAAGDQDMNEVADILLNMNVNMNSKPKRLAASIQQQ